MGVCISGAAAVVGKMLPVLAPEDGLVALAECALCNSSCKCVLAVRGPWAVVPAQRQAGGAGCWDGVRHVRCSAWTPLGDGVVAWDPDLGA